MITLEEAAELGCRACASPGGGCQFLGTAATSQVVAEALGLSLTALGAGALRPADLAGHGAPLGPGPGARWKPPALTVADILTEDAIHNAMVVHAAFGGSTNLLLHIPAIAHAAGLRRPTVEDWAAVNRSVPRLVDVLPNGPAGHPTVQVFLAGGVPEVMLHLRELGLLRLDVRTVAGRHAGRAAGRVGGQRAARAAARAAARLDGVDPDDVIMSPGARQARGLTSTVTFPARQPGAARVRWSRARPSTRAWSTPTASTARRGPARVFTSERAAIAAIKGQAQRADRGRRRSGADGARPAGLRHGRDLPGHLGAQVPALGQGGGADHRRPLQRRQHRAPASATSAPRRWRAARWAGCARAT